MAKFEQYIPLKEAKKLDVAGMANELDDMNDSYEDIWSEWIHRAIDNKQWNKTIGQLVTEMYKASGAGED